MEIWASITLALMLVYCVRSKLLLSAVLALTAAVTVMLFSPSYMEATATWAFPRCAYGFFCGVLTYAATRRLPPLAQGSRLAATCVEAGLVLTVAVFVSRAGDGPVSLAGPLLFAPVVGVFAGGRGAVSQVLGRRLFQRLGLWSFSIYMVNELVAVILSSGLKGAVILGVPQLPATRLDIGEAFVIGNLWLGDLLTVAGVLLSVGLAYVSWRLVEVPGRRVFYRWAFA